MGGEQPRYGLVSPNSSRDDELFPEDYQQFGTPVNGPHNFNTNK